jgi:uncharacterized protein YegP (UPF0339 family)
MAGKFEVSEDEADKVRFRLEARRREIVATAILRARAP